MKLNKMDVWIIWEINKHTAEVNLRAIDTSKELADKHKIGMEKMNERTHNPVRYTIEKTLTDHAFGFATLDSILVMGEENYKLKQEMK